MKKLLLLLPLLAACSKNCEDEKQQLYNDYQNALRYARTESAVFNAKQNYENRLAKLDCD